MPGSMYLIEACLEEGHSSLYTGNINYQQRVDVVHYFFQCETI